MIDATKAEMPQELEQIHQAASWRFTCRGYKPDALPRSLIERILATAQLSPSWCNTQPWHLIITEGEETARFAEALYAYGSDPDHRPITDFPFPARYEGVYSERRRSVGFQLYSAVGIAKGDRAASAKQANENYRLFGAPHAAILTTTRDLGLYGAVDCGVYLGNFMLAATAFGVATTAQAALATHGSFVRDYFGIADDRAILCGISFGWPDMTHPANSFRAPRVDHMSAVEFRG